LGDFDGDLESLDMVTPAEAGREAFVVDIMRVYALREEVCREDGKDLMR